MRLEEILMGHVITHAWRFQTLALPNPSVGALLFHPKFGVLSLEAHIKCAFAHAEVLALASAFKKINTSSKLAQELESIGQDSALLHKFLLTYAKNAFKGCHMYVSLEPCAHFGKTPPCADLLIALGIEKVFISVTESNAQAKGGAQLLKTSGISVESGILEDEGRKLLLPFLCMQAGRFNLFKIASLLDGEYKLGQISGKTSQTFTHNQRSIASSIVVSGTTFRTDSPRLDARFASFPYNVEAKPYIQILSRAKVDVSANPHTKARKIGIFSDPCKMDLDSGFNIIEGGWKFFDTLAESIDMILLWLHVDVLKSHQSSHISSLKHNENLDSLALSGLGGLKFLHSCDFGHDLAIWIQKC